MSPREATGDEAALDGGHGEPRTRACARGEMSRLILEFPLYRQVVCVSVCECVKCVFFGNTYKYVNTRLPSSLLFQSYTNFSHLTHTLPPRLS